MFTTLLESRPVRQRRGRSTFASALVHGTVIAIAVTITVHRPGAAKSPEPPVAPPVFVLRPEPRPVTSTRSTPTGSVGAPVPPVHVLISPPTTIEVSLPPIDLGRPPTTDDGIVIGHGQVPGSAYPGIGSASTSMNAGGVYEVSTVDRPPSILGTSPQPRYPASLRQNGTPGHVVVRFVVDTLGRAEMRGAEIVESTNDQFSDAVRAVLDRFRFNPGEVAGRKVRTLVQIPFTFSLQ